jgi:hypothetical protein
MSIAHLLGESTLQSTFFGNHSNTFFGLVEFYCVQLKHIWHDKLKVVFHFLPNLKFTIKETMFNKFNFLYYKTHPMSQFKILWLWFFCSNGVGNMHTTFYNHTCWSIITLKLKNSSKKRGLSLCLWFKMKTSRL